MTPRAKNKLDENFVKDWLKAMGIVTCLALFIICIFFFIKYATAY